MISVIILTFNSERFIERLLVSCERALRFCGNKNFEIFVFDNGSQDKTIEIINKYKKHLPIFIERFPYNKGTTFPRNRGIKKAKFDYILFLDSDIELEKNCVKILKETLDKDNKIAIAAPLLFYPSGEIQKSFKRFPNIILKFLKFSPFSLFQKLGSRMEEYKFEIDESKIYFVDYCISAVWLVKKEIFKKVGFFDENIFYSPEDVDFCLRCWLNGYKVAFVPKAKALHYTQRLSYKKFPFFYYHFKGLFYLFKKHKYFFSREKIYKKIFLKNKNIKHDKQF